MAVHLNHSYLMTIAHVFMQTPPLSSLANNFMITTIINHNQSSQSWLVIFKNQYQIVDQQADIVTSLFPPLQLSDEEADSPFYHHLAISC
ncbi:hypothetical protein T4D_12804 [Trichinella pseudospiralis]|uniref:Uncharacterized protein n=1 Tax=Trichinella pseudospiralis TaxID=6337 RepID=A0A0V1FHT4_TRIPS|nr:hypothetical protein T4D_12804 [Trichinella pseudospiralis]